MRLLSTRAISQLVLGFACVLPLAAQADPVSVFLPFDGSGSHQIDADFGLGSWQGSILPGFGSDFMESLSSKVLFRFEASSRTLNGSFLFWTQGQASTLTGRLSGSDLDGDGQYEIDYQILGGSGAFSQAKGFGLSLVSFDQPLDLTGFNAGHYAEVGVLALAVPEPSSFGLLALGLFGIAMRRVGAGSKQVLG